MATYFGSTKIAIGLNDTLSNVVRTQSRSVTPSTSSQTLVPDPGYNGMSQVTVNSIPANYIIPEGTLSISANGTYPTSGKSEVSVNLPYYEIYRSLANVQSITSSIPQVSDWCNSLSMISSYQFIDRQFTGSFTFTNVSRINTLGFGHAGSGYTTGGTSFYCDFPNLSTIDTGFCRNYSLITISAPKLTTLYGEAFHGCTKLGSVYFPSLVSINWQGCFSNCTKLSSISLPNLTIISGAYTFANCSSLTSINLPELTTLSGGGNGRTFYGCSNLVRVSLPKLNSITDGAYMFYGCYKLESIYIPSVSYIGSGYYMFNYCSTLETISFPALISISSCNSMFASCSNLKSVFFPNLTTINSGTGIFYNCSQLEQVSMPNLTTVLSGALGYMFYNCSNLSEISFPKLTSITGTVTYMFYNCKKLESVYFTGSSVLTIDTSNIFSNTPINYSSYLGYYGSIYVPSSLLTQYQTNNKWSYYSSRFVGV